MPRSVLFAIGAFVGSLSLFAAACAPAAEPAPQAPAAQQPAPQQPAAQQPATQAEKPAAQQPAAQQPAAASKPNTSVSGIPLDPNAKFGGIMITAASGEGPTMSTWEEAAGNSFDIVHPVSNMLVSRQRWGTVKDYEAGAFWNLTPDLAKSWEQSKDGLQWTFKLRENVKWSDGKAFTCADANWSLDIIRTGKGLNRSPRGVHFLAVSEVQCPDDLTLVVKMNRPKPGFMEVIGLPYNVVRPKHIYENNTAALRDKHPTVGTGPFTITERIPGEKTVFTRKKDYWDQPLPYLDGLEMRILTTSAQLSGMRAGRVDFGLGGIANPTQAKTLTAECAGCQIFPVLPHPGQLFSLIPNQQRPPWNSPDIRNAMSLALDRNKLIKVGYEGSGMLATGGLYLPGSVWAMPYDRVKQIPGYNFEDVEGNRAKARELIKKAGYQPGELKVEVSYSVGSLNYQAYAIPLVEDLNTIGIVATHKPLETALYYDTMSNGGFDVGGHAGYIGGFDPDFILYEYFYTGSDRNYGRFSNPEFDRLVGLQSVTLDLEQRKRIAWDASEIALREQARIFSGFQQFQGALGARIRGFIPGPPSQMGYGPWKRHETTWLAEK